MALNFNRLIKNAIEVCALLLNLWWLVADGLYNQALLVPYAWKRSIFNAIQGRRAQNNRRGTACLFSLAMEMT